MHRARAWVLLHYCIASDVFWYKYKPCIKALEVVQDKWSGVSVCVYWREDVSILFVRRLVMLMTRRRIPRPAHTVPA